MAIDSPPDIEFNRSNGRATATSNVAYLNMRVMQLSNLLLRPFGYLGISRVHGLLGRVFGADGMTRIVEGGFTFSYPSNDYYWNRMLDSKWDYEPEIDSFLREMKDLPFVFLDLGANFGFWSARVGSGKFGKHLTVAVEPSHEAFQILEFNAKGLSNEVRARRFAIDKISGKNVKLYGSRHAGRSIDENWSGASREICDDVETISIDHLFEMEKISLDTLSVIKLDVEGAELGAILGSQKVMNSGAVFIVEDAEKNGASEAISVLFNEMGCRVYGLEGEYPKQFLSVQEFVSYKQKSQTIRQLGINLIVTKSPMWIEAIENWSKKSAVT